MNSDGNQFVIDKNLKKQEMHSEIRSMDPVTSFALIKQ